MVVSVQQLIAAKRDGKEHSPEQISQLIGEFMSGKMADYQMSAWLMAAYLRGLSATEMVALTRAMLHSGEQIEQRTPLPKVDKHSTGGVGDKISLCLAPLVAACGVAVPMISGRGLGHTGGTLDKLEAIPGYRTQLSSRRFSRIVSSVGCSIIGQSKQVAPADRRIYALRDVTGTVACRPLIVASILSKKLAAGLDGLVLDVKVGRGAFMKTPRQARSLARDLVRVSSELGVPARARLTDMDQPLGSMVGNALEVKEALALLQDEGPGDCRELTLQLAAEMLLLASVVRTLPEARPRLEQALGDGSALEVFGKMIEAHGGDQRVVEKPSLLPRTRQRYPVLGTRAGFVGNIDPLRVADVAQRLGAGRQLASDAIDPAVGVELCVRVGQRVAREQPLAYLHARRPVPDIARELHGAFAIETEPPAPRRLLHGRAIAPETT